VKVGNILFGSGLTFHDLLKNVTPRGRFHFDCGNLESLLTKEFLGFDRIGINPNGKSFSFSVTRKMPE
jgi:hypothetical protein